MITVFWCLCGKNLKSLKIKKNTYITNSSQKNMDSGDQNIPERTARKIKKLKKGGGGYFEHLKQHSPFQVE